MIMTGIIGIKKINEMKLNRKTGKKRTIIIFLMATNQPVYNKVADRKEKKARKEKKLR